MTREEKELLKNKLKNIIAAMPEGPGSYQYYNEQGEVIYVGKAKNLKRRVSSYFTKEQTRKTQILVSKIRDIKYINVHTEQDALLLENSLIKRFQPRYNILLKDDKSYPYICLTKEEYPRLFSTYNKLDKGGEYFGPYSYLPAMYNLLELLRTMYKTRSCKVPLTEAGVREGKYKVCLSYHIKKCKGCCVGEQTKEEYLSNISQCRQILRGHLSEVKERLKEEMVSLASELRFEEAQEIKKKYELLDLYQAKSEVVSHSVLNAAVFNILPSENKAFVNYLHVIKGTIVVAYSFEIEKRLDEPNEDLLRFGIMEMMKRFEMEFKEIILPFEVELPLEGLTITIPQKGDRKTLLELSLRNAQQAKISKLKRSEHLNPQQRQTRLMKELQDTLHLPHLPMTVELFDNSNLQGQDAVAGCVVYKQLKPSKRDYRKYIIKTVEGADDYASMQEVVRRRYSRMIEEQTPLPDLIITDGGQGQMECVRKVVEDELGLSIPIAGLAKDGRHRTHELLYGFPPMVIGLKQSSELFHLLTQMQDEVHRYAISFHKSKRAKRQKESELDSIKGVGKTTKELLLKNLKTVSRIKEADLFELQNLLGEKKGENLWRALHQKSENPNPPTVNV